MDWKHSSSGRVHEALSSNYSSIKKIKRRAEREEVIIKAILYLANKGIKILK
jgi:hypothetical protein